MTGLTSLVLHGCGSVQMALPSLATLTCLLQLDVSFCGVDLHAAAHPPQCIRFIPDSLSVLELRACPEVTKHYLLHTKT